MKRQTSGRVLIVLLFCVAFIFTAKNVFSNSGYSPFFSPHKPDKPGDGLTWIDPVSGGKFTTSSCPGIEVFFPKGFYRERVNVHCNPATVKMQLGSKLRDIGQPFFFGTWSGSGEVTKFDYPLSFQITYEDSKDGKRVFPEKLETMISLYIWDEQKGIWLPQKSQVNTKDNYVTAEVNTLLPIRYIQGWDGNTLMALLVRIPK